MKLVFVTTDNEKSCIPISKIERVSLDKTGIVRIQVGGLMHAVKYTIGKGDEAFDALAYALKAG